MKRSIAVLWVFTLLFIVQTTAGAAVTLRIQSINKKITLTYGIDSAVEITETITVKHRGDATPFFITFSAGQSGSFESRELSATGSSDSFNYQLYDNMVNKNILKDLTGATTDSDVLTGFFPMSSGWQSLTVSYVFYMPANQFVGAGKYGDSVEVKLYEGTLSSAVVHDNETVNFEAQMDTIAEVSLVNTGMPFNPLQTELLFDFGILEAGESLSGDIMVRANALFTLSLQSGNRGVMANTDRSDSSIVPYEFIFNGSSVDLTGNRPIDVLIGAGPSDVNGLRYPFSVIIQPYGMATEGTYEDTITVTVSTR